MDDAQTDFIEEMGRHMEGEGVPRIGGRIYGFLLLQDEPCTLDQMVEALSVSKTSVSTNARYLSQRGLIIHVTKPGDRKDYYAAAPDQTQTLEVAVERVRQTSGLLGRGRDAVPGGRSDVVARFAHMIRFNDEALDVLEDLLHSWKSDH